MNIAQRITGNSQGPQQVTIDWKSIAKGTIMILILVALFSIFMFFRWAFDTNPHHIAAQQAQRLAAIAASYHYTDGEQALCNLSDVDGSITNTNGWWPCTIISSSGGYTNYAFKFVDPTGHATKYAILQVDDIRRDNQ